MGGILGGSCSTASKGAILLHFEDEDPSSLLLGSSKLMCCFCDFISNRLHRRINKGSHSYSFKDLQAFFFFLFSLSIKKLYYLIYGLPMASERGN